MNRVAFSIFNIDIYWYSICILIGIIIAYFLITKEAKRHCINVDSISNMIFYGIILGILGARLYYVIFNYSYYLSNPIEIFDIRNGGLAIHGGLIIGAIFIYFYTKKYNLNFIRILDIIAPSILIAQACGRWGNFFNQEAYGSMTTLSTLKSMHIPKFIIDGMNIDGNYYFPTFYFESICCLIGFIILLIIRKKKNLKLGTISAIYLIWYGVVRFFIESLRTDSLMLFNLKMAQIVSIFGIILGIVILIVSKKKKINYMEG